MTTWRKTLSLSLTSAVLFSSSFVSAEEIKTNTAVMQAMDKITGRVKVVEVPVNGNVDFGTFSILVRDCQTRPPEETPENYAFVDIIDNNIDGSKENIFRGWMMSSTPALNAVEHPIYDVWLLKCSDTEVDKTKLLSSEQLAERNSVSKRVEENKKLKEDFPAEELITPLPEAPEKQLEAPAVETVPEATQEDVSVVVPEEEAIKDGVIESEIVVKGLTPNEEIPAQPLVIPTEITEDGLLPSQEAPVSSDAIIPQEAPVAEDITTETQSSTEVPQQDPNGEPVEEFYDEFDSLIQE